MEKENKELKPIGDPNNWHIEVYPKRAGDFGFCSMSSVKYDKKEAEDLAKEIEENIDRHIDGVQGCSMIYDGWTCPVCENYFDTKEEAKSCILTHPPTQL